MTNCMDLETARRIARRPETYRENRLERALSILMRWAAEPCVDKEYWLRMRAARRVHQDMELRAYVRSRVRYRTTTRTESTNFFFVGHTRGSVAIGSPASA